MDEASKAQERRDGLHDADPLYQSAGEVEVMSTPSAEPVKLNTELHLQLLRSGKVRPSTLESAMAALELLREAPAG